MLVLALAFVFGAFIGSFLNVCIHRLPRNESIVLPPSRCYSCGTHVQWYDNLPVVSWLVLMGRCRWCKAPFSIRYLAIEVLVGALTAATVWLAFAPEGTGAGILPNDVAAPWIRSLFMDSGGPGSDAWHIAIYRTTAHALAAGALLALVYFLVVSVFTDLDHMIIPDELTKSFQLAAPFLAALCVTNIDVGWSCVHWIAGKEPDRLRFLVWFLGLVVGCMALLAASLPLARMIYSRFVPKTERWDEQAHRGFMLGVVWFMGSLVLPTVTVALLVLFAQHRVGLFLAIGLGQSVLGALAGWMSLYVVGLLGTVAFRRNAMGYGDVKFLAPIGCFLGPVGVLYAFFAAALFGTLAGVPMRIASAKREIPFGPYLALGALLVLACGPQLHEHVMELLLSSGDGSANPSTTATGH